MSPEIEAGIIIAASELAITAVKFSPPKRSEKPMPKLAKAFDLAYNSIHLKVEARLAGES